MNLGTVTLLLALVMALPKYGLGQLASSEGPKSVRVTARFVDIHGRILPAFSVRVESIDSENEPPLVAIPAKFDGVVAFSTKPGRRYRLSPGWGSAFKVTPSTFATDDQDHIDLGDIRVEPNVNSRLTLEQVSVDASVIARRSNRPLIEFQSFATRATSPHQLPIPGCDGSQNKTVTLEEFLGGRITSIRVVRLGPGSDSNVDDIRRRLLHIVAGALGGPWCYKPWAEGEMWNLEAIIDFEDSKHAPLLTDGYHAAFVDREGRGWYMTLWPAF